MLEIHNVTKQFFHPNGELLTASRVEELALAAGEQLILAGPSGSGKTTLLHLVAGLLSPTSGEICWEGKRLDTLSESKRDRWRADHMGYIFQNFNLLPALTVAENIMVAAALRSRSFGGEQRRQAKEMLALVGLEDKSDNKPAHLSTGEQQRVAVVRALINKPRLILADEPTASLDRDNAAVVLDLLQSLCRENHSSLILSTHDPAVMAQFPRIYEMRRTERRLA
ncbi:ABC transporter ATP-binding protein [Acetonema longum]|uniref:Phosphonate-transporting ATPase n=1 Tax=Acetonema longum DSM 6540 TaxID=1009370 RepID=F7NN62_9FIRM|nr:ABC transporter ATP-binding protein [Acetonema longum]EGO62528.1 phosphonate-transporting ATPase [Acetonema longum DSM 6540]